MNRTTSILASTAIAVMQSAWPASSCARAQAASPSRAVSLRAEIKPGEVLRYELEGSASFLPQADAAGAAVTPARGPCDYSLAAIVTLRPQPVDKDGNTPVEAAYSEVRVTSVRCYPLSEAAFQKRLAGLQASPVTFRVGPHGETGIVHSGQTHFNYWNGAGVLRKATLDLLQTQFSAQPVAPGASWKPRGQFAYTKDVGLRDLELSAADMRFRSIVDVAGKPYAWITSKHLFSPLDVPASATTRGGRVSHVVGNNAVAAVLEISLLLDNSAHHVAWLHRSQTIDNQLTVASPDDETDDPSSDLPGADDPEAVPSDSDDPVPPEMMNTPASARHPFMSFHFREEARARLLPAEHSMEWMAALRSFEQAPEPEFGLARRAATTGVPGAVAQAARAAGLKKTARVIVDSDTLLATPAGFKRYEKGLCQDAWLCATVSVALPGDVQVVDDTALRSVFLASKSGLVVSVAVGPALDRKHPGLTEEEELKKQTKYYLSNYVWMAVKPGIGTSSASATLDGYPSLITDFSATQRDLADMNGVLGMMLTPWGKIVPVSCESDHAPSAEMQALWREDRHFSELAAVENRFVAKTTGLRSGGTAEADVTACLRNTDKTKGRPLMETALTASQRF